MSLFPYPPLAFPSASLFGVGLSLDGPRFLHGQCDQGPTSTHRCQAKEGGVNLSTRRWEKGEMAPPRSRAGLQENQPESEQNSTSPLIP